MTTEKRTGACTQDRRREHAGAHRSAQERTGPLQESAQDRTGEHTVAQESAQEQKRRRAPRTAGERIGPQESAQERTGA